MVTKAQLLQMKSKLLDAGQMYELVGLDRKRTLRVLTILGGRFSNVSQKLWANYFTQYHDPTYQYCARMTSLALFGQWNGTASTAIPMRTFSPFFNVTINMWPSWQICGPTPP